MLAASKRIFGLDLLRALAIVLVLLTHSLPLLNPGVFFRTGVFTGFLGVELFFVLSGFLIGSILLKIHFKTTPIGFSDIKTFWVRRWFRTLPNYYLIFFIYALLFYLALHENIFSNIKYLSYVCFIQNAGTAQPNNFFQVAWSLSIEEWFYLVFPLLLLVLAKIFKVNRSATFLVSILVIMVVELALRAYVAIYNHNYWDEGIRKLMPLRLDSIATGVLAAYVRFKKPALWNNNTSMFAVIGIASLLVLSAYFYFAYVIDFDPVNWDHYIRPRFFLQTGFFTMISLSIAMIIPYLYNLKSGSRFFKRLVTFLSKISYSVYLSHFLIIAMLSHLLKKYENFKYHQVMLFTGAWIITLAVSTMQYKYFEVRMTALRDAISADQADIKI